MKYIFIFLLLTTSLYAKSYKREFKYSDFYQAKTAPSFLRFDMESTKMGMMTTSFHGVAKKFDVNFGLKDNTLTNTVVHFRVEELDTDVNDRNKKMYNLCFEKDKFPDLIVTLNGPYIIGKTKKSVAATMNVRGKNKQIQIMLDITKKGNKLIVTGVSQVSLKALEIPDPSIWIAKVKDKIELRFNLELDL